MKIKGLFLRNIRSFKGDHSIGFSPSINILVGPNNSGKSTVLNSIFLIQRENVLTRNDITIGTTNGQIQLSFAGYHDPTIPIQYENGVIDIDLTKTRKKIIAQGTKSFDRIPEHEPYNLIYPYLSKRKTINYSDAINESNANSVRGDFTNLYSKIDRLVTPDFQPAHSEYVEACKNILDFQVSSLAKGGGKQAVLFIFNMEHIPLTSMGEGVANILGLVTDLCVADKRIFLIEEPENDIHPKALKALLDLIAKKSIFNQFFISTHSNIVMKYLGAVENSKIFNVTNEISDKGRPKLKLSKIQEISESPIERKQVLEDLGYDFFDYDLWKAWLFLEESSAEVIIRDYLIKWFVPSLKNQLRTFSAGSTSKINPKFDDFNKLFVFLHLEPTYKNKVWVFIDSGKAEEEIINKMKEVYSQSGWDKDHFNQFSKHDFEEYYPQLFQDKVKKTLAVRDKQKKRSLKKGLLDEVKAWISENEKIAKEEFRKSAAEIIDVLKNIQKQLK